MRAVTAAKRLPTSPVHAGKLVQTKPSLPTSSIKRARLCWCASEQRFKRPVCHFVPAQQDLYTCYDANSRQSKFCERNFRTPRVPDNNLGIIRFRQVLHSLCPSALLSVSRARLCWLLFLTRFTLLPLRVQGREGLRACGTEGLLTDEMFVV